MRSKSNTKNWGACHTNIHTQRTPLLYIKRCWSPPVGPWKLNNGWILHHRRGSSSGNEQSLHMHIWHEKRTQLTTADNWLLSKLQSKHSFVNGCRCFSQLPVLCTSGLFVWLGPVIRVHSFGCSFVWLWLTLAHLHK